MQQKDFDFLAIDFETYYDDEYSLTNMDPWHYVFHEKFDAYLVAIHGAEGPVFIGHPSKCDWSVVQGKTIAMHNAGFDLLVYRRLQQDGIIPASASIDALDVWDTIDMAGFLGMSKRNLAQCSKYLLGEEMSKAVRAGMKGRTYNDAVAAGGEEDLLAYGGKDAENTYRLADKYRNEWPENERLISNLNRETGYHGVAVNVPLLTEALRTVKTVRQNALNDLPWVDEGEKPLSPAAIRAQGRKEGVPVPGSLAKTSPEVQKWEAKYAEEYPWVRAVREYRSVNTFLNRLKSIEANLRDDGTMGFQIKYFGAGTGRMSGGAAWEEAKGNKFNMQNMPRAPMFGVDLRNMLVARPGHKIALLDYAQIEARVLLWVVRDKTFLDLLEKEGNLYQAYAKKTGYYKGTGSFKEDDPTGYHYIKCCCLSPETLVLTDRGYIPIIHVTDTDRVWDGESWVSHEGVIKNGTRNKADLVYHHGEGYTDDHGIFVVEASSGEVTHQPAGSVFKGQCADSVVWRQTPGSSWSDVWALARAVGRALFSSGGSLCQMCLRGVRDRIRRKY